MKALTLHVLKTKKQNNPFAFAVYEKKLIAPTFTEDHRNKTDIDEIGIIVKGVHRAESVNRPIISCHFANANAARALSFNEKNQVRFH